LRVGIFGAEPWTEQMRAEIEGRAGLDAVDIYGLSEVIGPGVAQESAETKDGLHIWEDHFFPEVVDPASGQPVDGAGELVFTSLTKQAMPIIRYRTRDLTELMQGTAHPPFRRMAKVTGRTDDMIILRGVNVFPTQIEEIVLTTPGAAPHFQLVLSKADRMDHLTVRVEADGEVSSASIISRIKDDIGVTVAVEILPSGTLERSTGKLQRVVRL
jgi:phenylacetate-CoA ligase